MKGSNRVRIRIATMLLLLAAVIVFSVQNAKIVEIRLLFWEFGLPRSLLIFVMLLIGIIIGWFMRATWRISRYDD